MMEFSTLIDSDESETSEANSLEEIESPFAWELRVMLISAVWMLPGFIFGLLVRLCVPDGGPAEFWLVGGGVLGAIMGGFLEADHWLG
ncbi:MAG TPA: hypothetical protein VG122_05215 [Gemmata sp.]|jgi:hypothetical protein|nr:hypothetical protein [Gemmata sp.]